MRSIATSALATTLSADSASVGYRAMPMVALRKISWPAIEKGAASASWSFARTRAVSLGEPSSRSTTANLSPPILATVSFSHTLLARRSPNALSTRSPAARPKLSFTRRKRSTFIHRIPTSFPERAAPMTARSTRSAKRFRLGSPVSES